MMSMYPPASGDLRTFAKPENESSMDRIAFWIVSSNVLPIAITSPTDFMLLLSSRLTRLNFFRSHLGIFTTT
jgi:hypothetical protein